MFGGFFNRMYYGNPNKPDMKKEDTETGRFKLFFIVLQVRFWKLIQLNLLYSIFWIPAFFVIYTNLLALAQNQGEIFQAPGQIQSFGFTFVLLLAPCIILTGPATAGVTYIIRNWARDEHAWVWSDFKDAWKQNWKESLVLMLINAIALPVFYVSVVFYGAQGANNTIFVILQYLLIAAGFIFAMMNMFTFPMLVTYKLKIRQILKNAFIFTVVELPKVAGIFILAFLLFGVLLYFSIPFILPFFILGLTFPMFITISFTNWVFDKYLNRDNKGQAE